MSGSVLLLNVVASTLVGFFRYVASNKMQGHFWHMFLIQFYMLFNMVGPYDLDLKKGVDFGLKNSVYLDLNSFALSNFDLKPNLYQQCT